MKHKLKELFLRYGIKHISLNSKDIGKNSAFFAVTGRNFNGNDFIEEAFGKGALIVFTDNKSKAKDGVIFYLENIRLAIAHGAEILYPKMPKNLVGVTGTNGKSSVVSYVHQILSMLGKNSACIGTLGVECNAKNFDPESFCYTGLTTGDPVNFRKYLDRLYKLGVSYLAFEASSHGLDQQRLGDIKVNSAAFTSFSQDHLDYHETIENYLQAKLKLFSNNLIEGGLAVINSETQYFDYIKQFLGQKKISYNTVGREGDLKIIEIMCDIECQNITFGFEGRIYRFQTNIIGSFQATNILIAAKLVHNLNIDFADIVPTLTRLKAIRGRLQRITEYNDPLHVFVDYAHTPDALEKSLTELKKLKKTEGKLYVIFGCGGDRDRTKRPLMGKIAAKIADKIIITDDNPRSENPAQIRNEILAGAKNADIIGDRKEAIVNIINILNNDDILLIAGKGHEDYQIIGNEVKKFSDIEIAKNALNKKIK